jgi:hypothetical protein
MRYQDSRMAETVIEKFIMQINPQASKGGSNADLYRLLNVFFSLVGTAERQISISIKLAPLFTTCPLYTDNLKWASCFQNSQAWELIQQEENSKDTLKFSLSFRSLDVQVNCTKSLPAIENFEAPIRLDRSNVLEHPHSSVSELMPKKGEGQNIFPW